MDREPGSTERTAVSNGFRSLRAFFARLTERQDDAPAVPDGRFSSEIGFYALDDVACIRLRRR